MSGKLHTSCILYTAKRHPFGCPKCLWLKPYPPNLFLARERICDYASAARRILETIRQRFRRLAAPRPKTQVPVSAEPNGNLIVELFRADPERSAEAGGPFEITVNGMRRQMESGDRLVLTPGESVCLEPVHAHRFYAEPGSGTAMVGEVSAVNDDANDNCFLDDAVRFDPILEDEEPEFLLAADCRRLYGGRSHA